MASRLPRPLRRRTPRPAVDPCVTPAINDWLAGLIAEDEVLRESGLAALWRESPVPLLAPGERLATMASLTTSLIERSGLDAATWLRRYLDVYLSPLLHCFYEYDLVFMPHGENVILVLDEDGVPKRASIKDIAEEIAVLNPDAPLPPEVERIRAEVPEEMKILSLFTDVFDCFLRFLNGILATDGTLDEDGNNQQMVGLQDPDGALQLVGELDNPLARFAA